MKKTFLGLDFELKRKSTSHGVSMADIKTINDDQVANIRTLSSSEIQARLADVLVDGLDTAGQINQAERILRKYGIVVIPDYIDPVSLDKFRSSLTSVYKEYLELLKNSVYEDSQLLVQRGAAKVSGYRKLATYSKPVMQVRGGQDDGMIDIFNVDHLLSESAQLLRAGFEKDGLKRILSSGNSNLTAENLNCYINESISQTRGFHADSYGTQLKGFIYLTDVRDLDDGPYTYVRSSHKDSAYRRANKSISESLPKGTEAPLVNFPDVIPVVAPKGSLVISDQSGFHRGFPQGVDRTRMIAVMNYR